MNKESSLEMLVYFKDHMTVAALRRVGYKIRVNHTRYSPAAVKLLRISRLHSDDAYLKPLHELYQDCDCQEENCLNYVSSLGGKTVIELTLPSYAADDEVITAEASCVIADNFSKRKGVNICLGRIYSILCQKYGVGKSDIKKLSTKTKRNGFFVSHTL